VLKAENISAVSCVFICGGSGLVFFSEQEERRIAKAIINEQKIKL